MKIDFNCNLFNRFEEFLRYQERFKKNGEPILKNDHLIYEKYKLSSSYNEEDKVCGLCVMKSVLLQDENYKKVSEGVFVNSILFNGEKTLYLSSGKKQIYEIKGAQPISISQYNNGILEFSEKGRT